MVTSLSWLKKIDEALLALDERPQFGTDQPFPLEELQSLLRTLFKKPTLALNIKEKGWKKGDEVWQGFGGKILPLMLEMTPLEPPLYFVMSEQDLKELMGEVLGGDPLLAPFYESVLAEGFYQYLALEVMHAIEEVEFAHPLSPRLKDHGGDLRQQLTGTNCYVIDAHCQAGKKTIWGRLLIPEAFRRSWKEHFAQSLTSASYDPHFPIEISLQVGHSEVVLEELKGARAGDVILLDGCSFDSQTKKGSITVMLGDRPIFRGKFKEEKVELLEFPFEELGEGMNEDEFEDEEEEEETPGGVDVGALPVSVAVEVARLRMTIKELSELSPGSLLDLNKSPDGGVSLLVNGKQVGRGELVQIGETVGVRIISI